MLSSALLIVVDCLRLDRVRPSKMPFLCSFAEDYGTLFTNYWSTSHCTDPAMTHMLSGCHPDELGLYSMMYEIRDYRIPDGVEMLSQLAKTAGYRTGFVSNLSRWYRRGVDVYVDCRGWLGMDIFGAAGNIINKFSGAPWFVVVHTDDMHTEYTGGSYDTAAAYVDSAMQDFLWTIDLENTLIIIVADHGEGLGDRGIKMHGFGLYDFLTNVPCIVNREIRAIDSDKGVLVAPDALLSPGSVYSLLASHILDTDLYLADFEKPYVCQAGDTPPRMRHRGVVFGDGSQFVRKIDGDRVSIELENRGGIGGDELATMGEFCLRQHCSQYGIDYDAEEENLVVGYRLGGLGYFG